ncbi:hypothetical protein CDIK_1052 [Cucumispora dikerogammari]|nr:hypothetical protein CDIK_1052 [Cucumispora dikerogammari]
MNEKILKQINEVNNILNTKCYTGNQETVEIEDFVDFLEKNKIEANDFLLARQYLFVFHFLQIYSKSEISEKLQIQDFCKSVNDLFRQSRGDAINPLILRKSIKLMKPLFEVKTRLKLEVGLFSFNKKLNEKYGLEI